MRLSLWLSIVIVAASALADPLPIARRIETADGITLTLATAELQQAAIVVTVTVDNPGSGPVRLNPAGGFVLRDDANGIHRLNPPPDNPDLEIQPRSRWSGELVFTGPLAPAVHALTLSSGGLHTDLPIAAPAANDGVRQENTPDGAALRAGPVVRAGTACILPLLATNGSDHTLLVNRGRSLVLRDAHGVAAPLRPPVDNWELVVPIGNRLDANLVFDCRALVTDRPLTLAAQDTGLPPLVLPPATQPADAATAPTSRVTVTPLPASRLALASASASAVAPAAKTPKAEPKAPPQKATAGADEQLTAALHARKTERGLRLTLPADALFAAGSDRLEPAALRRLQQVASLIAAAGIHEVVVTVHAEAAAERARAVIAWLTRRVAAPPPHFVAKGEPVDQLKDDASADTGASEAPAEAARKPWVDVILRRDYLVPNSRSPASPNPGKM